MAENLAVETTSTSSEHAPTGDQSQQQSQRVIANPLPDTILRSPAAWGELFLQDRDGTPRKYRVYQREDLECTDPRVLHLDGRSVGKTVNLATLLLWFMHVHRGKSVLVACPYQGHLDTIIDEVEFQLNHNELLRNNLAKGTGNRAGIKRHPYFQLRFRNGCRAYFRPAGTDGDSFRSLHVDFLLVDEAAWLPEKAWTTLRQCLNPRGLFRIYSTPNGLRDRTFYRLSQSKEWRIFRWPSWIAPDWNRERRKELADFYGGESTAGWRHEVAGEHGMPSYGAFNQAQIQAAMTEVEGFRRVDLDGDMLKGCDTESEVRDRLEALLSLDGSPGRYWLGGDLGYTSDPTELLLLEEDEAEGVLSLRLRVHAEHIPYPAISEMISLIDRVYQPIGLGIDRGGNGLGVEQELLRLDKYKTNNLAGRLRGIDFGGTIPIGEDDQGRPIKKRTKELMTQLINKLLAKRALRLPAQDAEVEDQLCTQTYILSDRGVVYSKGHDHIVDALRCAVLCRDMEIDPSYDTGELIMPPVKILRFIWPADRWMHE